MGAIFYFDLHSHLTLDKIKEYRGNWQNLYADNPIKVGIIYFIAYMLTVACSIPGAVLLTLFAGALFGFLPGLALVSFASSIGATLAMLASRYFFSSIVTAKLPNIIRKINEGLNAEGGLYLFGMRLAPIIPFFLINIAFGVTKYPTKKFYLISQIGMLPGTTIYVFAGQSLGSISSVGGIFSTEMIIAFTLLAIFPIIVSKVVKILKKVKSP